MRSRTMAILGGAALALVLGAAAAVAQPPAPEGPERMAPGMGPGMGHAGRVESMTRFLSLTEPQQAKVKGILEELRPRHQALREKVEANRTALREMLDGGSPDATAVGELVIEGHRLHEQGRALRAAQDKAIRGVLTPEQQVKFDAMSALRDEGGPMGVAWPRRGGHGMRSGAEGPHRP